MRYRTMLVPSVFFVCVGMAQTLQTNRHAQLVRDDLGKIHISVDGTRPLAQVVTAIRRQYGWVVDYEESEFLGHELKRDIGGLEQVARYHKTVVFPEPREQGLDQPLNEIQLIVNQFKSQDQTVRVDEPVPFRYSVSTSANSKRLLLDTLIVLPHEKRSIESTVPAICNEAARSLQSTCTMGGLVDGQLLNTTVDEGSNQHVQARLLLARALETAPNRKVWILTYDPAGQTFVMGIQPAVF